MSLLLISFRKMNFSHPEQLLRQVPPVVDASVHGCEPLNGRFVLHVGVVKAGVQHDHSKRQHVTCICKTGVVCLD